MQARTGICITSARSNGTEERSIHRNGTSAPETALHNGVEDPRSTARTVERDCSSSGEEV
jgi:hypothetical protein